VQHETQAINKSQFILSIALAIKAMVHAHRFSRVWIERIWQLIQRRFCIYHKVLDRHRTTKSYRDALANTVCSTYKPQ
jgi:hypothetical protein